MQHYLRPTLRGQVLAALGCCIYHGDSDADDDDGDGGHASKILKLLARETPNYTHPWLDPVGCCRCYETEVPGLNLETLSRPSPRPDSLEDLPAFAQGPPRQAELWGWDVRLFFLMPDTRVL